MITIIDDYKIYKKKKVEKYLKTWKESIFVKIEGFSTFQYMVLIRILGSIVKYNKLNTTDL